ncbi:hypothetical protein GW17_00007842 [Ensete ventricosum]|nr:hypothetical protein GW17_00007842 [Ensete ventricosum]
MGGTYWSDRGPIWVVHWYNLVYYVSVCSVQLISILVPVVTATITVDPSCQYREDSFPHFRSLADSIMYVMEQFFGLVNNFLQNHRDTWKRRLRIRTYKVSRSIFIFL